MVHVHNFIEPKKLVRSRSFKQRTMFAICAISVNKNGCGARNFVHIQENLVYSWRFWLQVVMILIFGVMS